VRESPILSTLTALGATGSFLAFPLITFLPVIAGDVLKTGAAGYSLLLTSLGVGAIAGAVTTAQRGSTAGRGRLMLLAFMGFGVATFGAVLVERQWLAMALLTGSGFSLTTAFSTLNSLVQEHAPNALRGRVLSIFGLAFRGGMPVGSLAAGALVKAFGAPAVMGTFAGVLFVVAATIRLRNERLRAL
jgi:MFS family permease